MALGREMSTPPKLQEYGTLYFFIIYSGHLYIIMSLLASLT